MVLARGVDQRGVDQDEVPHRWMPMSMRGLRHSYDEGRGGQD
jgi:hypothetical protein